jgi:hypothetical protein
MGGGRTSGSRQPARAESASALEGQNARAPQPVAGCWLLVAGCRFGFLSAPHPYPYGNILIAVVPALPSPPGPPLSPWPSPPRGAACGSSAAPAAMRRWRRCAVGCPRTSPPCRRRCCSRAPWAQVGPRWGGGAGSSSQSSASSMPAALTLARRAAPPGSTPRPGVKRRPKQVRVLCIFRFASASPPKPNALAGFGLPLHNLASASMLSVCYLSPRVRLPGAVWSGVVEGAVAPPTLGAALRRADRQDRSR